MKRNNKIILGLCVLCIVIALSSVGATTFAKYVSEVGGKTSMTTSAGFYIDSNLGVQETGDTSMTISEIDITAEPVEIDGGYAYEVATYTFTVQNYNDDESSATDVDVEYTVEIDTTQNIKLQYKIESVSSETFDGDVIVSESVESGSFSSTGSFIAGDAETHEYKITIYWKEEDVKAEYANMVEYVEINIIATQTIG